jgi:hypothetical protein
MKKQNSKEKQHEKELQLLDLLKVIIAGNQELDAKSFKKLIDGVGANYNAINKTSDKLSMQERRKRMQDNYIGTTLQLLLQIAQVVGDISDELIHIRVIDEAIAEKLEIAHDKRLTEKDKLIIEQTKYMKLLNEAGQIKLAQVKEKQDE